MSELEQQIEIRRAKRRELAERGVEAYPARCAYDLEPTAVHERFDPYEGERLEQEEIHLVVPGRVRSVRSHGKATFVDISDGKSKLQLLIRQKDLPEADGAILEQLDLGDYVGARGQLMRTRTGELTIRVDGLTLLAKALRPLPEKWHGLADVELRYRQRYLDLLANPESRKVFETRAAIIRGIRRFLDDRGFLEVETPMMHVLPGGAAARPFVTHHNTLDLELYLRIAPELFLKRLLVGGLHRVYEINRNFRNEGISTQHNPEFTMLEFYCAYSDYRQLMDLTEELLMTLAQECLAGSTIEWQGNTIDLASRFQRFTMKEAVAHYGGIDAARLDDRDALGEELEARGVDLGSIGETYGHRLAALFEGVAEEHLVAPTFVLDFPVEISPLAKQTSGDPRFTERFELYLGGMEIANAFSELNDPDVQAQRFREQLAARESGDAEAHRYDADYVRALEFGMPPAGGEGVGIDRLAMLFTDRASIRDVILFPLLRPDTEEP